MLVQIISKELNRPSKTRSQFIRCNTFPIFRQSLEWYAECPHQDEIDYAFAARCHQDIASIEMIPTDHPSALGTKTLGAWHLHLCMAAGTKKRATNKATTRLMTIIRAKSYKSACNSLAGKDDDKRAYGCQHRCQHRKESLPIVIIGIVVGHDNDRIDDNAKRHRNACQRINMQFDATSTIDDYGYQDVSRQSRCHHHKIPSIAINDPHKEQQDE